jgi:hypothetical protein
MTYEVYPLGGSLGPYFIIKNGKMYRAWGHPQGEDRLSPCCYQSGNYFYREMGDILFKKQYDSWVDQATDMQGPIFARVGKQLHSETGHPEGAGKIYYELRQKAKPQTVSTEPKPAPAPSSGGGGGGASYTGESIVPLAYKIIAVISLGFVVVCVAKSWIPGQAPFPIPDGYHATGEEILWFWASNLLVFTLSFFGLSFLYWLITKD